MNHIGSVKNCLESSDLFYRNRYRYLFYDAWNYWDGRAERESQGKIAGSQLRLSNSYPQFFMKRKDWKLAVKSLDVVLTGPKDEETEWEPDTDSLMLRLSMAFQSQCFSVWHKMSRNSLQDSHFFHSNSHLIL